MKYQSYRDFAIRAGFIMSAISFMLAIFISLQVLDMKDKIIQPDPGIVSRIDDVSARLDSEVYFTDKFSDELINCLSDIYMGMEKIKSTVLSTSVPPSISVPTTSLGAFNHSTFLRCNTLNPELDIVGPR